MKGSVRTVRIMEYVLSAWLLLLSFYWISIAELMETPGVFFAIAIGTFLLSCGYFLLMLLDKLKLKKILLVVFITGTIAASVCTIILAPACTCKIIQSVDLLPQGIACLMALVVLFTRVV